MNLLLDTHVAMWALNDDPHLSSRARNLILDPDNTIFYSVVSVWEVMLKHEKHPKMIPFSENDFDAACKEAGFIPLHLSEKHILSVRSLSRSDNAREHNDPFDRLLISQAKTENYFFITHDELIPGYKERCIVYV